MHYCYSTYIHTYISLVPELVSSLKYSPTTKSHTCCTYQSNVIIDSYICSYDVIMDGRYHVVMTLISIGLKHFLIFLPPKYHLLKIMLEDQSVVVSMATDYWRILLLVAKQFIFRIWKPLNSTDTHKCACAHTHTHTHTHTHMQHSVQLYS